MQNWLRYSAIALLLNSNLLAADIYSWPQGTHEINANYTEDVHCFAVAQGGLTGKLDVDDSKRLTIEAAGQTHTNLSVAAGTLHAIFSGQSEADISTFRSLHVGQIELYGQSKLKASLQLDKSKPLTVLATVQSKAKLSGTAGKLLIRVNGQSQVEFSSFKVQQLGVCEVEGQSELKGSIDVDKSKTLTIVAKGQSTVSLSGTAGTVRLYADGGRVDLSKLTAQKIEFFGPVRTMGKRKGPSGWNTTIDQNITLTSNQPVECYGKNRFDLTELKQFDKNFLILKKSWARIITETIGKGIVVAIILIGLIWFWKNAFEARPRPKIARV